MKKHVLIIAFALVGTYLQVSHGYEVTSKLNLIRARLAVQTAKRVPILSERIEAKLNFYRQWHMNLKSARTGSEFNTALDVIENDLDRHIGPVSVAFGSDGHRTLKTEIHRARVDIQRGHLDLARQRVERAAELATQIDLNI